jgi:hypothetical protein
MGVIGRCRANRITVFFEPLYEGKLEMSNANKIDQRPSQYIHKAPVFEGKKVVYRSPSLTVFGSVSNLTRTGAGSGTDGGVAGMSMKSDRRTKENIIRIGEHGLGIGLYLFDYKPEFRAQWNVSGRQFGVMADEVEAVMPEAVVDDSDGYKMVNYSMLGISHTIQ